MIEKSYNPGWRYALPGAKIRQPAVAGTFALKE